MKERCELTRSIGGEEAYFAIIRKGSARIVWKLLSKGGKSKFTFSSQPYEN